MSPTYIDSAYGSLFQRRTTAKGHRWFCRPSFRHPGFSPGKGEDGAKFGDWQPVEFLGPERALKAGHLVPYNA